MPPTPTHTVAYKNVGEEDVLVDVFLPPADTRRGSMPVYVYFHGGGMTAGDRTSWFPEWMLKRAHAAGFIFLSPDYRLLAPATGHDILSDVLDLFAFIGGGKLGELSGVKVDLENVVVAGSSAGGFCAFLAGAHVVPKPRCVVSMYSMGGDVLTIQYLTPKTKPFFLNREILSPTSPTFSPFIYPFSSSVRDKHTIFSRLSYHPETGYPTNPRMQLCRLYLQMGTWLDYWTGDYQEGGLSGRLKNRLGLLDEDGVMEELTVERAVERLDEIREMVPSQHHPVFPQLHFYTAPNSNTKNNNKFPPTFFVHGRVDTAVSVRESINAYMLLRASGVETTIRVVDGKEHSFDYEAGSDEEGKLKGLFDEVFEFVGRQVGIE